MNILKKVILFIKVFLQLEKDEFIRLAVFKKFSDYIFGKDKYRLTFSSLSWFENEYFNKYLKKFSEISGYNTHRRFMLYQLLRLVDSVEGDTAECGVYKGASSWLICSANERSKYLKTHFCFDSFEGLSEPGKFDTSHWCAGKLASDENTSNKNLQGYNFVIMKGWIPETFREVQDRIFSFVHIDVDLYQPTLDSITFFYPRMNKNGIMVFDDYGFDTCLGATKAIDEYLKDKPEKPIMLPVGGAFLIKGWQTADVESHKGKSSKNE